ncbi:MAG: helicase, partial [Thermoplasmata archaeon]
SVMNAKWSQNVWQEHNQIITSIDFAKQEEIMFSLSDTVWDLVIVDEAHKMSAYQYGEKISKTGRYKLGELISKNSDYLLFLTATPHRGDPDNFRLFLDLLEPGFFASNEMLKESIENKDNPLFLRRLKEDLKNLDGSPIFPPRDIKTIKFTLSDEEKRLYNAVTKYVEIHFNKALSKEKRNVAFAMTILQRRLASSVRAIRKSLERRKKRLEELLEKGALIQQEHAGYTEEYLEDLEESERWKKEEDLLERLSSAETLDELKEEIEKLGELIDIAKEAEKHEIETKLNELKKVIDSENLKKSDTKLLIFTESKDTLDYLEEKLRKWNFSVTTIHGGMSLDKRIAAEAEFKNETQIMVATEAAGEGINLQFCWLMVNYDIPWNPNRLEQRMGRIHRYGQQHEVHVYNLVAYDTREGKILHRLFEKLQVMKDHLGDRVFDVIGEVLQGISLRDLILDAIANKRTMDDILKDIDLVPNEEIVRRIKEVSMEALATKHIDLRRILGEQRVARENRLVPEYISEFFRKTADVLNIKMKKVDDKLWNIISVPYEIRSRPHSFKLKYGVVNRSYRLISFDKQVAFHRTAEFVAMGHPLMEAIIDTIFYRFRDEVDKGAVFIDPEGKRNGLLWFLEAEILDGAGRIAGRRMFSVYQDISGSLTLVNPAILWDFKPGDRTDVKEKIEYDRDRVSAFVVQYGLEDYKNSLLKERIRDASIKKKYGLQSLDSFISRSEEKLADYEIRRMKGEDIPEVTILNERRKRDQYIEKKERLKAEITAETHLLPQEPRILSVARIVPIDKSPDFMKSNVEVEKIGMEIALKYEREQGREPIDVSSENLGYDIRSTRDDDIRYIEVKARAGMGSIALTPNEWLMAQRLGEEYWLYIVANVSKKPMLYRIQNPASKLKPEEEISIVRYVVKNWSEEAELVDA